MANYSPPCTDMRPEAYVLRMASHSSSGTVRLGINRRLNTWTPLVMVMLSGDIMWPRRVRLANTILKSSAESERDAMLKLDFDAVKDLEPCVQSQPALVIAACAAARKPKKTLKVLPVRLKMILTSLLKLPRSNGYTSNKKLISSLPMNWQVMPLACQRLMRRCHPISLIFRHRVLTLTVVLVPLPAMCITTLAPNLEYIFIHLSTLRTMIGMNHLHWSTLQMRTRGVLMITTRSIFMFFVRKASLIVYHLPRNAPPKARRILVVVTLLVPRAEIVSNPSQHLGS